MFANLQTILPTWFAFSKHTSFAYNLNYAEKNERHGDVKTLVTPFLNFIWYVSIELFVMAYDQIINLNQNNSEPGTN